MRVMLSEMEQTLLRDVSFEAFRLYVQCLKPVMDVRTGLVGRSSEVSRAYMAIDMKFIPDRGSRRQPVAFTPKQIDALIDELIRKGLVERASTVSDRQKLVLRLPAAQLVALVRPVEDGNMRRHDEEGGTESDESGVDAGFDGFRSGDERDGFGEHEADISRNHGITTTKEQSERVSKTPRASARGSLLPAGFAPDASNAQLAQQRGLDVQLEALKFAAYFQGLDTPVYSQDWQAKFRKWLLDARPYAPAPDGRAGVKGLAPSARSAGGSNGKPWFLTASGIEAMAKEIGYTPPEGVPLGEWRHDVYRAAGVTEEQYRRAASDYS